MPHLKLVSLVGDVVVLVACRCWPLSAQTPRQPPPSPGASPPRRHQARCRSTAPTAPMTGQPIPWRPQQRRPGARTSPPRPPARSTRWSAWRFSRPTAARSERCRASAPPRTARSRPSTSRPAAFSASAASWSQFREGRFTKAGDNVQLGMTADEVSKLPEVKEQS